MSTNLSKSLAAIGPDRLAARLDALSGRTVKTISLPGGNQRNVLRVTFHDGPSWILIKRDKDYREARERQVLDVLAAIQTKRVPRVLGVLGEWTIISDLGKNRLTHHIQRTAAADRWQIVENTAREILAFQDAANACPDIASLPPVLLSSDELSHIATGPERTCARYKLDLPVPAPDSLLPWIGAPTPRFIKGDCRAANIVMDDDGMLGWIDFEYAGLRHGSEDLAWLLCDETLAVPLDGRLDAVDALIRDARPDDPESYLKSFCINATLHAGMRLRVIHNELRKGAWLDYGNIIKDDLVGVHPELTMRLARKAGLLADQYPETRALVDIYAAIGEMVEQARTAPD